MSDESPRLDEVFGKDCTVHAEFGYRYRSLATVGGWSKIVICGSREEAHKLKVDFEHEFGSHGEAQALRRIVLETDWSPMEWSSDEPVEIEPKAEAEVEHARLPYKLCQWYGTPGPPHPAHPYEQLIDSWYWCPGIDERPPDTPRSDRDGL